MKKSIFTAFIAALTLCSCGGGKSERYADMPGDTLTHRSELLTLIDRGDFVTAEIADPWNSGKRLAAYALVDRNKDIPQGLDEEFTVVAVPLQRSVIFSSTNSAAIAELGALNAIAAVADGNFYSPSDTVARLIAQGRITDIGSSMSPDPEKIVNLEPDALLVSPFQNAGHGVLEDLGVPVIECADYMENSPLARAEWILFLGELYGNRQLARDIFTQVSTDYEALTFKAALSSYRPLVLPELVVSGVWYVPGGQSYMATMFADAGAAYPWADDSSTGSLQLSIEQVIDKASDADIWIMRNFAPLRSNTDLLALSPLYSEFKAFRDGRVYNCDTSSKPIFNDIAFHPERVLLDFIIIFHPELFPGLECTYYQNLAK
ncbi:MAG: ABC transporter substrate-binding protein [Muribaculaceae bacterium]|nr:ABC transporter substrate-binding protein [Muribaculaceae bacterium]